MNDPIDTLFDDEVVADDGFTDRVLARLPRRRSPRAPVLLAFAAAAGGLAAALVAGPAAGLAPALAAWASGAPFAAAGAAAALAAGAAVAIDAA